MMPPPPAGARTLAYAATALAAAAAVLATLGTLGFLVVAPGLKGIGGGGDPGEGLPAIPFAGHGLGFSLYDAVASALVGVTLLLWCWVALDFVAVLRPLGRRELLTAEAAAVQLGLLQLLFGGLLPGLLLLIAARRLREEIRSDPAFEARRSAPAAPPGGRGPRAARGLYRVAAAGLGALWAVAGLSMFQNQFYLYLPALIQSASRGTPPAFAGWFHFWAYASSLGGSPAADIAGVVQLVIATSLLLGLARKAGYFLGVLTAVFVWVVPEAFGGPFVLGAFSLGPGVVYAVGMLALVAWDARHGPAPWSLDALIERRYPTWARIAEVSSGLVPPIGQWYVRNAGRLARAGEGLLGLVLAGGAAIAVQFRLWADLGATLSARSGGGPLLSGWYDAWSQLPGSVASALGVGMVVVEIALAILLLLGRGRRVSLPAGVVWALALWSVVEAFGGAPGPGYTDPGVGIATACVFLALLGLQRGGAFGPRGEETRSPAGVRSAAAGTPPTA